jgi:hypothetical protein
MEKAKVDGIVAAWKANGFKMETDVYSKADAIEILAEALGRMYPTENTVRNVLILCENDRDDYTELLRARVPNLNNLSGRGLAIYSMSAFTRLAHIQDYNCLFVIRDTEGWAGGEELATGSSKFKLRLMLKKAQATAATTDVVGTKGEPFSVQFSSHGTSDALLSPVEKGEAEPAQKPRLVEPLALSVPVREVRYGLDLDEQDKQDYNVFSKYIDDTYSIFGSQRNMERAYMGDYKNNMSAEQVCNDIAAANGWSTSLDMTQTGDRFIDETYSPMALKERVKITYNYGRARAKLISDYSTKIPVIADIIERFEGGCLILSKGEEFTNKIVKDLNVHFNREVVLPFHDAIPSLSIKGKNGKMKPYGARSQSKDNLADFHCGRIWALSAKGGSLWKDIPFIAPVIIITSPMACDLQSITKRCVDSTFGNAKEVLLFKIFMNDTIEENVILRQVDAPDYEQIGGVKREKVVTDSNTVFLTF